MPEDPSTTPAETPPPAGDPAAPAPSPATEPDKTFTQEQFNREAGRIRAETKRAATKELADQLGVSVDEAKKLIEEKRQADEAAKTEVEKAREEAAAAKAEADAAKTEAARHAFENRVYRKLSAAGVGAGMEEAAADKQIARARRLLDLADDAADEDIAAQIAEIKADVPGLFTKAETGKQTVPSGVTGGRPPAGGQATGPTGIDAGREMARKEAEARKADDPLSRFHVVGRVNGT